jgi:hypothetical protein
MHRGLMLICGLVVLLIVGVGAWWWSTPGQSWWMMKRWEWWVLPDLEKSPGGVDPWIAAESLEPQWSRLLRRKSVAPCLRAWDPAPTDEQMSRFWDRVRDETMLPIPGMLSGGAYLTYWINGERLPNRVQPSENAHQILEVFLLLPPNQHILIDRIGREEFGRDGRASSEKIPEYWELKN